MQGFSKITTPFTFMLRVTSSFVANKLISISECIAIKKVCGDSNIVDESNMIDKASVISKDNTNTF